DAGRWPCGAIPPESSIHRWRLPRCAGAVANTSAYPALRRPAAATACSALHDNLDRNPIGTVEFAKQSATPPPQNTSIYPRTAEDGLGPAWPQPAAPPM